VTKSLSSAAATVTSWFFSVRDDMDNRTIIQFIRHRERMSFGAIRKELLRPWIGRPASPTVSLPHLKKTAKDRQKVERVFAAMDADAFEFMPGDPAACRQRSWTRPVAAAVFVSMLARMWRSRISTRPASCGVTSLGTRDSAASRRVVRKACG
jgi:hypothetical protein